MKFTVSFKTPGVVKDSIKTAVKENCKYNRTFCCERDCRRCIKDLADEEELKIAEEMMDTVKKFVKHGETIAIEFDTETKTARVVEAK
jgi:hypothetical protein